MKVKILNIDTNISPYKLNKSMKNFEGKVGVEVKNGEQRACCKGNIAVRFNDIPDVKVVYIFRKEDVEKLLEGECI